MAQSTLTATKPELGILFVHGIGQQHQGQTLMEFADPISRWLVRWVTHGSRTEAAVGKLDRTHVSVDATILDGDEPAHLSLTVCGADDLSLPRRHRWLLAESWWAETFQPPRTTSLLLWILLILPYVSLVQFYGQLLRALRPPARSGWGREVARWLRVGVFSFFYV